ncbi:MAG: TetR/AcrR family transcriptional regulator [Spirochaetales bacterium]|nr:TetR/AcrR family transcriptional regulator [Spirochaetales bacterium]
MPSDTFFNLPKEKQERIIDSALTEFSKVHYRKVTIDMIVEKAEIPKGSFYQYFENKNDLFLFIFNQIGNEKKEKIEEAVIYSEELGFKDYIIHLLDSTLAYENNDLRLINLKKRFTDECPQEVRKAVLQNEIPKSYRMLEDALELYVNKGELRKDLNTKVVAYLLTSFIINLDNYEFESNENYQEIIAHGLDTILNGIGL